MKLLVLGSGGREHALAWKLHESQRMEELYCAPGNAGIAQEAECIPVDLSQTQAIVELAKRVRADLTIVGPEAPLVAGVVDEFEKEGLAIIGPSKAASRLEGSKIFAKEFMWRHGIPTARFEVAESFEEAVKALARFPLPVVVKADGLAAGKGVVVAHSHEEAEQAVEDFMLRKTLGSAGDRVVIEECLTGEETSFIVLTDGRGILPLVPTQDHKALLDWDQGPNTGGMGAYSDDSILSESLHDEILRSHRRSHAGGHGNGRVSLPRLFVFRADDDALRPHAAGVQRPPGRPRNSAHLDALALRPRGPVDGVARGPTGVSGCSLEPQSRRMCGANVQGLSGKAGGRQNDHRL